MWEIPLSQRSTLRDVRTNVGELLGSMHQVLKECVVKCVSSTLKPFLQDENTKYRLKYALSMSSDSSYEFKEMLKYYTSMWTKNGFT